MSEWHESNLFALMSREIGDGKARYLFESVKIDADLLRSRKVVSSAELAMALNLVLFIRLIDDVPESQKYVAKCIAQGTQIRFDHGAVRTICLENGAVGQLPSGARAITRILEPLGYKQARTYPLLGLKMTGYAWVHSEYADTIPQFFISELHVNSFSDAFQEAATRVFSTSHDPLDEKDSILLKSLGQAGYLDVASANTLLASLVRLFARQHGMFDIRDYETLLTESPEAAWIATEGNVFNHATDRVHDVNKLSDTLRAQGYQVKESVELSANGRIRQTALRASIVQRTFRSDSGFAKLQVPGSFFEFISRDTDHTTGQIDLGFDSSNAQGIFQMTKMT